MIVPKTLVILATVVTATATRIHNGFGHDGWIQDDQGNNHALDRYATVTINVLLSLLMVAGASSGSLNLFAVGTPWPIAGPPAMAVCCHDAQALTLSLSFCRLMDS
jgi:hypothetical protein